MEIRHSWKAKNIKCTFCTGTNLKKNITPVMVINKHKLASTKGTPIPGTIVNQAIEESKKELRQEKRKLRNRKND
jgi:hypothetical protein